MGRDIKDLPLSGLNFIARLAFVRIDPVSNQTLNKLAGTLRLAATKVVTDGVAYVFQRAREIGISQSVNLQEVRVGYFLEMRRAGIN